MMRMLLLAATALFTGSQQGPVFQLNDAPVGLTWEHLPAPEAPESMVVVGRYPSIFADFVGESLRVVVAWGHPTDGLGNEDSTVFRIKSSNTIRFTGGGTLTPDTWRLRKHLPTKLADTFKLLTPPIGDSVFFNSDSIRQCRQNKCSVPGTAAWGYHRTTAPPAMTFIKVSVDSF